MDVYALQRCSSIISYVFSLYMLLQWRQQIRPETFEQQSHSCGSNTSGSMFYFNTLVLLKTKTHSYQTPIVVHLIWLGLLALSEIHGCLCFSTETNISGGRELPQGVITTNCITCFRSHTHALSSVSHMILNQTAKMKGEGFTDVNMCWFLSRCCTLLGRAGIQGASQAAPQDNRG